MYGVFYGVCRARCPCRHVYMSEGLGTPECEFWFQRKLLKSRSQVGHIAVGRRLLSRDPRDDARALARLGVSNRRLKSPIALGVQQHITSLRAPWSADRRADASILTTEAPQCAAPTRRA